MEVIDTHVSSFTDRKIGEVVAFARPFAVRPADGNGKSIEGEVAETIKIKLEVATQAPIGSEIQPYYDKHDNIHAFDVVPPAK